MELGLEPVSREAKFDTLQGPGAAPLSVDCCRTFASDRQVGDAGGPQGRPCKWIGGTNLG